MRFPGAKLLLVAVLSAPVATFFIETAAPSTTAFVASVTVPATVPDSAYPNATGTRVTARHETSASTITFERVLIS